MKVGIRKPSVKKRISAKTTGKIKRNVKSTINPLYGKKGMRIINDPEKAIYNKIYNKATISADDIVNDFLENNNENNIDIFKVNEKRLKEIKEGTYKRKYIGKYLLITFGAFSLLNSLVLSKFNPVTFILGLICIYFGFIKK